MNPDRLRRIEEIFHDLIVIPLEGRQNALEERCGSDLELRAEVEQLLAGHAKAESEDFLIPPGSAGLNSGRVGSPSWWTRRVLPGASVHIRCPNCNVATEVIVPDVPGEVTCPACHHGFQLPKENWTGLPRGLLSGDKRKFGRFDILDLVGFGAFGNVYKAFDPTLQKVVALKVLRAGSHTRFIEDARSSAQLRHPSIVSAHEVSTHDETPFIVSDFIDGMTLAQWIRAGRPSFHETSRQLKALAEALQYAHEMGVIHRDFKPSNIMIDRSGKPYLLDFGLAKREASEVTMTLDGQVLGTAAYMSPEQARGEAHKVDRKSDIYSLGVVLYEMLTGGPPFRGSLRMLLYQVLNDEPRPPRSINEQIPRDLETICLRCMSKEPLRRYSTARQVADDLDNFLGDRPIVARPVTVLERGGRWCRRNPRLATSLAVTAASLILVAILSVVFATNRGIMLAESNTRLAEVNFELARAACDRGEIGHGLHLLRRTLDAATAADSADWARVARANLSQWSRELPELRGVFSHAAWITDVEFSPDGKTVLTASNDGKAKLWDVATSSLIHEIRHQDVIYSAVFAKDGKTIVTASADKTARLWDVVTGNPRGQVMTHDDEVYYATFSPDGTTIATASEDRTVRLWEVSTGKIRQAPLRHLGPIRSLAFSPDGKIVATASDDKFARLWDCSNGQLLGEPLHHDQLVWTLAFSPDGKTLVTASKDKTARLWDVATARELRQFLHTDEVFFVEFSHDGKTIATASKDKTARLWDSATGASRGDPLPHNGSVITVTFSPDDLRVATTSVDHEARVWDVATGRLHGRSLHHESEVSDCAFNLDGTKLVTCSIDNTAKLWDLSTPPESGHYLTGVGAISAMAMSPDGKTLLLGTDEGRAIEWDVESSRERGLPFDLKSLGLPGARVTSVAYRPDGAAVLIGDDQGRARLWQVATRTPIGDPLDLPGPVALVLFSPDNKKALISGNQGWTLLCDATTGMAIGNPLNHGELIWKAAFSRDGMIALTASNDGPVKLWDTSTGASRGTIRHDRPVLGVEMSPDNTTVITACHDGSVRLWDFRTGKISDQPMRRLDHQAPVQLAIYSHDGKKILTSSQGGMVQLWEADSGLPYRQGVPMKHASTAFVAAFSPDDGTVATGTLGGVVQLWDTKSALPIGPPVQHPKRVRQIAFNPEGSLVAVRYEDLVVRIWELPRSTPEFVQLEKRIESLTGLKMSDRKVIEVLDNKGWLQSRQGLRPLQKSLARDANPLNPR